MLITKSYIKAMISINEHGMNHDLNNNNLNKLWSKIKIKIIWNKRKLNSRLTVKIITVISCKYVK